MQAATLNNSFAVLNNARDFADVLNNNRKYFLKKKNISTNSPRLTPVTIDPDGTRRDDKAKH